MELKRVLGFTTNSRNSFVSQPNSGNIIYVAGCVVVLFNQSDGSQQHLISESKQTITCLAVSEDGHYLATADCANKVTIRIWNLRLARPQLEAAFSGHNYELSCMSFSCNNELLVSIGSQLDLTLNIWNWRQASSPLASHKLTTKVRSISFSADDSYFVTVGEAHVKYWYLKLLNDSAAAAAAAAAAADNNNRHSPATDSATDQQPAIINKSTTIRSINEASSIAISCRAATLGDQRGASFCDVKCGRGGGAGAQATYCITKQGLLCELNSNRLLHKWVDLRTASANCLAVGSQLIAIGCANGVVRCFSAAELRFMMNLPRPHLLGTDIATKSAITSSGSSKLATAASSSIYPSLISVGLDEPSQTIACVYNDRSVYIWNLASPDIGSSSSGSNGGASSNKVVVDKNYSALYHSSCIWGIDVYPAAANQQLLPPGSFVTCSSDDTLRVWRPPSDAAAWPQQSAPDSSRRIRSSSGGGGGAAIQPDKENVYIKSDLSEDCLKIVFTDPMHRFLCDLDCSADGGGGGGDGSDADHRRDNNYDSNVGLRCLKLSPNGRHLAVGSRSGAIRVFDFELDVELKSIAAHDAEVLCLEYSDPTKFGGFYYLASSSRDKLIHLFDAANEYTFLQTIDDHSSSITALRFVNNRTDDCLQLISCGTDQKIVFRTGTTIIQQAGGGPSSGEQRRRRLNFVTERLIEGKTTFFDMEVDSESSCLMTACQDRMIRLFNVAQVKYQSGFRGSAQESSDGTIIKLALDPSCTFLAASCTDKTVSVYDYQRGESVATISEGLSDLVTDMKFSPDGSHLILCSGNGCIFIFSSPAEVANASRCLVVSNEAAVAATNAVAAGLIRTDRAFDPLEQQQQQQLMANGAASAADYLVQQNSSLLNQDDDDDDDEDEDDNDDASNAHDGHQQQQRQHDHRNQQSQLLLQQQQQQRNEFYLDEEAAGQQYARSQRSASAAATATTAGGRGRLTRESAGGLVSNMAKYFQSRENLDKISSRQRYIHEGLFSGAPRELRADGGAGRRRQSATAGQQQPSYSSSLSGRFVGKDTVGSLQAGKQPASQPAAAPAARAKSLSRLSTSLQGGGSDCRRANSSGDELSSADDDDGRRLVADLRDFSMDRTSRQQQQQQRLQPQQQLQTKSARARIHQRPTHKPMQDETDYASASTLASQPSRATDHRWAELTSKSVPRRTSSKHSQPPSHLSPLANLDRRQLEFVSAGSGGGLYNSSATMRSSRSESNLRLARPGGASMDPNANAAAAGDYDLQRENDFDYEDDAEQGDDVYELLAQRLHFSRLDANRVAVNRELCQHVVEELRLLSKFATRLHQRLHSAGARDLAGLLSRGVQSSLDVLSIVPPRAPVQPQFRSQINLMSGRAASPSSHHSPTSARLRPSAVAAAAPPATPRSQTGPRRSSVSACTAVASASGSGGGGGGGKQSADYKAASQQQVVPQQQPPVGHSASDASKVSGEAGQQRQPTSSSSGGQQQPARLNIDQVLEAYSDRLFKMVQQRMEWSNGAAAPSINGTLGPDSSASKQQANER